MLSNTELYLIVAKQRTSEKRQPSKMFTDIEQEHLSIVDRNP
jgi:hypothetical protein